MPCEFLGILVQIDSKMRELRRLKFSSHAGVGANLVAEIFLLRWSVELPKQAVLTAQPRSMNPLSRRARR